MGLLHLVHCGQTNAGSVSVRMDLSQTKARAVHLADSLVNETTSVRQPCSFDHIFIAQRGPSGISCHTELWTFSASINTVYIVLSDLSVCVSLGRRHCSVTWMNQGTFTGSDPRQQELTVCSLFCLSIKDPRESLTSSRNRLWTGSGASKQQSKESTGLLVS